MTEKITGAKSIMIWKADWEGEMKIEGFLILSDKELKIWRKKVKSIDEDDSIIVAIGANEDKEYENTESLLNEIEIKSITENEYTVMYSMFGNSFGNINFFEAIDYFTNENED